MNRQPQLKITDSLLAILIFFFPLFVFWIAGRPLYIWLELLFSGVCFLKYKKYYAIKAPLINMVFISIVLCTISAIFSDMASSYRKAAVVSLVYWAVMYVAITYTSHKINKESKETLEIVIKAFKVMLIVELLWIPLQYFCYHFLSVDINDVIFVKTFHMVDNASFVRNWTWYPSGLTWHSAVLAPMFVLGLLIFNQFWVKALIVVDALICGNSTALVGVLLTIVLLFLFRLLQHNHKVRIKTLYAVFIVLIVGGFFAFRLGLIEKMQQQVAYTYMRIISGDKDSSTMAHLGYFTDYFKILKNSTLSQMIFGYGDGCSGYPISLMYGRYTDLDSWSVECDFVSIAISRGIFGFVVYYAFLISIARKGIKVDKRYLVFAIVIIIEGFGYNVQWEYLFFVEMIFYICIRKKINFFNIALQVEAFGRRKKVNDS